MESKDRLKKLVYILDDAPIGEIDDTKSEESKETEEKK